MGRTFKDLGSLFLHIKKDVADSLLETSEVVKDVQQKKIDEEVYDAYNIYDGEQHEPFEHGRRRNKDGLRDRRNMIHKIKKGVNGVELSVENIAKGAQQDIYIAPVVEYGEGYDYTSNRTDTAYQYTNPRPFTEETVKELQRTGKHVRSLKQGLIKRGNHVQ